MFDECLRRISSEWMLERYCEDDLGYIAPVQIPLDQTERHGAHFQYTPLKALLSKIAQNDDVWAMLNQEETPKDQDVMKDYTDGEQFKSCELSCLSNLRLHFYIDEFEIVNPLGSKRGKHKLTAVYFKLGNIDKKYTSKLENIYQREYCFSSLNYAPQVITHLFPPDVMQDVLEGVIPNVLRWIPHQLIQDKHFTQLNFEIENFPYSVNDKTSKPQILTERMLQSRGQLSGKVSETWTLFRLLPLMVGSYVPPNKYWNCYMLLREVVDVIMAPVIEDLSVIQDMYQKRPRTEEAESGEDDYSIGIHLEKMRTECSKKTPNIRLLQDCIARTRNERADYCLSRYPALKIPSVSLIEIMMEGEKICEVDDVTMAPVVLMAIHFIFNTEYALKMRNTLKIIEKYLMCHNTETKMPPTYEALM
ncbi:zinc finger protein [Labeo rohita]|uniref:Zinc finger protein n=1 Tax=Labeo rohita TaxID=84645 RepID=A0A498MUT3_LABRO|nr:zinc finger protein [Labeo rohita]